MLLLCTHCMEDSETEMSKHMRIKTCVKRPLSKRPKIGFQDQLSLNAGQKYCGMLQEEHSAILSTFIKLPFVIKTFVLSIFEWQSYTAFTVLISLSSNKGTNKTQQSLHYSHTSLDVAEDMDQNLDLAMLDTLAWAFIGLQ